MGSGELKIVAFAPSLRAGSYNRRIIEFAADRLGESGAAVEHILPSEYRLPIYDQDIESNDGLPGNVLGLRRHFDACDAFVISTPEYNGFFPPLLKNITDWCSRPLGEGEESSVAFDGKPCLLLSGSPGRLGGMRAVQQAKALLGNLGLVIYPDSRSVAGCSDEMFSEGFAASRDGKAIAELVREFASFARKVAGR